MLELQSIMNRKAGINLLVHAAIEAIQQWAQDVKGMRMGILVAIHTFGADMKWHPLHGRDQPGRTQAQRNLCGTLQ